MRPYRVGALTAAIGLAVMPVSADIGPIHVGDISFGFFPPYTHTETGVASGQLIHGLRLVGDWDSGAGGAWSWHVRVFSQAPDGVTSSALEYGGRLDADPYRFDGDRYLVFLDGAESEGDWKLSFSSALPGSTAHMSNVQVSLLTGEVASFAGDTAAAPFWDRPLPGFAGISPFGASRYHVQPFTVDTTGRYDVFSSQTFDGFVFLYAGGFDPLDPLANGLAENDDGRTGLGTSDVWRDRDDAPLALTAGVPYFLVTTGFEEGEEGAFTNYIGGVGRVTFVPEPAMVGVLVVSACGAGRRRRVRRTALGGP